MEHPIHRLERFLLLSAALVLSSGVIRAEEAGSAEAAPILEREQVTGDWFGVRPLISDKGVDLFAVYTVEVWGNTTGGMETGSVYTGLLAFGGKVDLEKAVGWKGASLSTTWLWLSGRDASEDLAGNFLTVSNISGFNTLRMSEAWFQQNLLEDKISIRLGQLLADSEFLTSDYSGLFINSTFGWPPVVSMNLPGIGPAYPMGRPGVRVALQPVDWFTWQSGAYQGNGFEQDVNRHGFRWEDVSAQTGFTFLNEAQFRWNHREEEAGLPGQLKAGVWFQTGQSADALAESTGSGNSGFYLVLDQMIYREPTAAGPAKEGKSVVDDKGGKSFQASVEKSDQGLGWFGRTGFAPADRNFISFYFDTGLSYKGLLPTRDADTLGIAFGYAQLSQGAQNSLQAPGSTPAGAEMVVELTYQARITPCLVLQPDLQYIINPGCAGGLHNALVIGCRAAFTF